MGRAQSVAVEDNRYPHGGPISTGAYPAAVAGLSATQPGIGSSHTRRRASLVLRQRRGRARTSGIARERSAPNDKTRLRRSVRNRDLRVVDAYIGTRFALWAKVDRV